jgi:hypothetical protein
MATTENVFAGFWTNWTDGRITGATLTLSHRDGAYLIAFLAIVVRIAGGHFWQSLCYFLFQTATVRGAHDEATEQQQAILRNSTSDTEALWNFIRVGARKHRLRGTYIRSLLLMTSAVLNLVAFGVAGIFSSRVTNTRSEVLLRPTMCGDWRTLPEGESLSVQESADQGAAHDMLVAEGWHFSSTCGKSSARSANCNAYGRRLIDWTHTMHDACPFDQAMCANQTVVKLDSGVIDSHLDLGINSPPHSRVTFQKTMNCAPLIVEGRTKTLVGRDITEAIANGPYTGNSSAQGKRFTGYYYGQSLALGMKPTFVYTAASLDALAPTEVTTPYTLASVHSSIEAEPSLTHLR